MSLVYYSKIYKMWNSIRCRYKGHLYLEQIVNVADLDTVPKLLFPKLSSGRYNPIIGRPLPEPIIHMIFSGVFWVSPIMTHNNTSTIRCMSKRLENIQHHPQIDVEGGSLCRKLTECIIQRS